MVSQYSVSIGVGTALVFLYLGLNGIYFIVSRFLGQQIDSMKKFLLDQEGNPEALSAKVNFLLEMVAKGNWSRFQTEASAFAVGYRDLGSLCWFNGCYDCEESAIKFPALI